MIKMKTIIVFMLSILIYSPSTTQDGADVKNKVFCNIAGSRWVNPHELNKHQLPERCDIIDFAWYEFGRKDGVIKEDKDSISCLVKAGKTVYTRVEFMNEANWISIFDPSNKTEFNNKIFDPLVNFLNNFTINGLIIEIFELYDFEMCNKEQKISAFVSEIKEKVNNLMVGMLFAGSYHENFRNNSLFDFAITNKVVDLYIIDMTDLNLCSLNSTKTDVSPLTSTNPNLITIEKVTSSVICSSMDKSKIFASLLMLPVIPWELICTKNDPDITTYSKTVTNTSNRKFIIMSKRENKNVLSNYFSKLPKTDNVPILLPQIDTPEPSCSHSPTDLQINENNILKSDAEQIVEDNDIGYCFGKNYCSSTDKTNSSRWCINTPQLLYDQGAFVKKFYSGIFLDQLDSDDYEGTCKCDPFPTTNIAIDGWEGSPFKDCPALN